MSKDEIHAIKDGIHADAKDWVGVTLGGDVITTGPDGDAINEGHVNDFVNKPIKKFPLPE